MRSTIRRLRQPSGIRATLALALGSLALGLAACQNPLARIDAQTAELLQEQSAILGAQAAVPGTGYRDQKPLPRSSSVYRSPETANSPHLTFKPADEARDVEQRLRRFHASSSSSASSPLRLTLTEVLRLAQESARDYRQAEEAYILAAIGLLTEEHRWGPRFFADTSLRASGSGTDGSFQHAVDIVNTLRATKRLPYGGQVEARLVWNATEQLRQRATGRYRQSSSLVLSGDIPLLRGGGMVARESLIQRQRNIVYAARTFERFRRQIVINVASDYFNLVASQKRIENQRKQLEGLKALYEQTSELVDAGRARAFQMQLARSQVLGAQSSLASQEESFQLQLDRFKVRLALSIDQPIEIIPVQLSIPEPDTTIEAATEAALTYRLDLQNQRDRVEDQLRAVEIARNQLLPDLNLAGNLTVPTDRGAREGGFGLDPEDLTYSASMTLGLPLDRQIERLGLRSALINAERARRDFEQARDTVVIDARGAMRGVELARLRLNLAEQQVLINKNRLAEQEALSDQVNPQAVVDTQIELNRARNARDQAASDLKVSVLRYLLQTGQLRVTRDGWISPPEGMGEVSEQVLPDAPIPDEPIPDAPLP
jgi:outer membrane protein TolC